MFLVLGACDGAEQTTKAPEPAPAAPKEAPAPAPTAAPAADDVMKLPEGANPALLDSKLATETAPSEFKVKFETTKGDFVVLVHPGLGANWRRPLATTW